MNVRSLLMATATVLILLACCAARAAEVIIDADGTMSETESPGGSYAPSCEDKEELCEFWASEGECQENPDYMKNYCAKACNVCGPGLGQRKFEPTDTDLEQLLELVQSYGERQVVEGSEASKTMLVLRKMHVYMKNFVHRENPTHSLTPDTIKKCTNRQSMCAFWAAIGECEANVAFMATNCAPSCQTCHLIDFATRCPPLGKDAVPAMKAGDLHRMFERIVATAPGNQTSTEDMKVAVPDGMPPYTVTIHGRPGVEDGDMDSPWVITLDNFLTDEECDRLVELGHEAKYEQSLDVGEENFDGSFDGKKSQRRTSKNAWCSKTCRSDKVTQRILERIAQVTGVNSNNYEDFQILKYEVGQFYRPHHDYIPHQQERQSGPRILTFFLYLSDVEVGGGTSFPDLAPPITVYPKKGRALLWPSVMNSFPSQPDKRTQHEALPVEKGVKYAANAWIHLYDNVAASKNGCT